VDKHILKFFLHFLCRRLKKHITFYVTLYSRLGQNRKMLSLKVAQKPFRLPLLIKKVLHARDELKSITLLFVDKRRCRTMFIVELCSLLEEREINYKDSLIVTFRRPMFDVIMMHICIIVHAEFRTHTYVLYLFNLSYFALFAVLVYFAFSLILK